MLFVYKKIIQDLKSESSPSSGVCGDGIGGYERECLRKIRRLIKKECGQARGVMSDK